jgi:hypothetical protein
VTIFGESAGAGSVTNHLVSSLCGWETCLPSCLPVLTSLFVPRVPVARRLSVHHMHKWHFALVCL